MIAWQKFGNDFWLLLHQLLWQLTQENAKFVKHLIIAISHYQFNSVNHCWHIIHITMKNNGFFLLKRPLSTSPPLNYVKYRQGNWAQTTCLPNLSIIFSHPFTWCKCQIIMNITKADETRGQLSYRSVSNNDSMNELIGLNFVDRAASGSLFFNIESGVSMWHIFSSPVRRGAYPGAQYRAAV